MSRPFASNLWLSRLGWRQSVLPCAISVPVYERIRIALCARRQDDIDVTRHRTRPVFFQNSILMLYIPPLFLMHLNPGYYMLPAMICCLDSFMPGSRKRNSRAILAGARRSACANSPMVESSEGRY